MVNLNKQQFAEDFLINVLLGRITGVTRAHVLGQNNSVGTAFEDIQISGGIMTYLTSATILDITSDNANDTSIGTGARTIKIEGLDNNFKPINDIIIMNGLTIVNTNKAFRRINTVEVITAGSDNENIGLISIKSGSNIIASIAATYNTSEDGKLTVQLGKVAVEVYLEADAGSGKELDFRLKSGNGEGVMRSSHVCKVFQNTLVINLPSHIYDEKTDIRIQGKVTTGSAAAIVMAHYILIDKGLIPQTVFD